MVSSGAVPSDVPLAKNICRLAPALLALALAGCVGGKLLQTPLIGEPAARLDKEAAAEEKPKEHVEAAENATSAAPRPRTLPQAVCAYLRSWHEPLPEPPANGNGAKEAENKSSKEAAPSENGKEEKKQDGADADKEKNGEKDNDKAAENAWLSAHAQATMVTQTHDHFHSPYVGPNSLLPVEPSATSLTATLFLVARLWECDSSSGELIFNPELAGGRGLSNVLGVAGFPNGEITRVGTPEPTPYIARLFYRHTWGLGGEQEKIEDEIGENQIPGSRDINRITVSVGKFTLTDVIDDNRYSHDPRTQFLNWAIMYNDAWDYPSNVRGYSYGFAIEFNQKDWALRYGIMAEPAVANGAMLDPHFLKANGQALEWEVRYKLCDHSGIVRLLAYFNRAHMGDYREALTAMPVNPDVTLTRAYRYKYGFGANWEQEVTKDLGLFGRLGWNDGHTESWSFTAIDRTACLGLLLKGRCWRRPRDQFGIAGVLNGLSLDHRDYLAAGGLDFDIGDGRLNYGLEETFEVFYNLEIAKGIVVSGDFQEINHPAYNRDRGPVAVGALRVHIEF